MASSKGTTAELDSVICMKTERPSRLNTVKPKGTFCKVLAVIEVSEKLIGRCCKKKSFSALHSIRWIDNAIFYFLAD